MSLFAVKKSTERKQLMFKVWVRHELEAEGQLLTECASLDDVESICRSMNANGVTGYEDASAAWNWVADESRAGLEIVLAEVPAMKRGIP